MATGIDINISKLLRDLQSGSTESEPEPEPETTA